VPADSLYFVLAATAAASSENFIGLPDEAIARLRPVADANPTDAAVAFALANIYQGEYRYEEAIEVITPAIEALTVLRSADWRIYFVRGIAFERTGQWPAAVEDFRHALVLSANQPDVLNYLGYTWVDRGENLEEAMTMIQRAVAMRPDAGYILDSLGWGYYKTGDYAQAVTILERALDINPYRRRSTTISATLLADRPPARGDVPMVMPQLRAGKRRSPRGSEDRSSLRGLKTRG
jgi:tetratricopeptide (TPR) repeat protein